MAATDVLHELVTNSAKYGALTAPEGRITANWSVKDKELVFRWQERGGPPVSAPASSGFGLTLIEQSAKSRGGSAHALWQAEGVTWDIVLPLGECAQQLTAKLAQPRAAQQAAGARSRQELRGKRFLVVEDEPFIALHIAASLSDAGAEVAGPAGTEEAALRLIEETALDAALLDVNLHGKGVDRIAAALTRGNVPFAFVTGNGREGLPKSFAKAAILSKPFSEEQLFSEASRLIGQQGKAKLIQLNRGALRGSES